MKRKQIIYLLCSFIIIGVGMAIFLSGVRGICFWGGWSAISAIASIVTSISIVLLVYQLTIQKKAYNIDELNYVMNLTEKFYEAQAKYSRAWKALRPYGSNVPKEMKSGEWFDVVHALEDCYESAYLNFQVAQLVEHGIIDLNTLYLLQFNYLTEHPDSKLSILFTWVDTGLDLAANYDKKQLLVMIKSAMKFYGELYRLSEKNGIEGFGYQLKALRHLEEELHKCIYANEEEDIFMNSDKMVDVLED